MGNMLTIFDLLAAILIVILYPFAMAIYQESKNVKNEYYKKSKESIDTSHD